MSNYYVYVVNHETKEIHKGVADGRSTKFDPRCNVPLARAEGAEGTDTVDEAEAETLIVAGYSWCGHDVAEGE